MILNKCWFTLVVILITASPCFAQMGPTAPQMATIQTMINGYNQQDYKLMKKPWGLLGKLFVTQKKLRQQFQPYHTKYGQINIDTVVCSSIYECTAILGFEKDPYKRSYLQFIFNDHARLQGFGFGYPKLVYPHREIPGGSNFTAAKKAAFIDSIIHSSHQRAYPYDLNGCVMARQGGSTVYKNCFGKAQYEDGPTLNDSTRFLLASCSKQFTAMGILLLVEAGQLRYDDTLRQFFPHLPYKNITVEHLLTHTSGLPDYMPLLKKHWDHSLIATNKDVVTLLVDHQPAVLFAPNDRFSYSNTGYVLLAGIIEKISGQTYGEFLEKQVFQPLGMDQTIVVSRRKASTEWPNYAYGYVYSPETEKYRLPDSTERYRHVYYMDGITGDDGVSSSINDLALWTTALQHNRLLSDSTYQRALTPHLLNNGTGTGYGYGFFISGGANAHRLIYHTGGWPGYFTVIIQFIDSGETVIILSNNSYDRFLHLADEISGALIYR